MACPRCGSSRSQRPTQPPTIMSRPGGVIPTPRRSTNSVPNSNNISNRDRITKLRYVP